MLTSLWARRGVLVRAAGWLWCFVVAGCVSAATPLEPPATVQLPNCDPTPPCESVMQNYCTWGHACGAWSYGACFSVMFATCAEIVGITEPEAAACGASMRAMSCETGQLPESCVGIGELSDRSPTPAPERVGVSL